MRDNNPNWRVCKILLCACYGVLSRHAAGENQVYCRRSKSCIGMTHLVPVAGCTCCFCSAGQEVALHHTDSQILGATSISQRGPSPEGASEWLRFLLGLPGKAKMARSILKPVPFSDFKPTFFLDTSPSVLDPIVQNL